MQAIETPEKVHTLMSENFKQYLLEIGDPTSTRDENISLYISECKPHPMSRFYGVELGLKSTS